MTRQIASGAPKEKDRHDGARPDDGMCREERHCKPGSTPSHHQTRIRGAVSSGAGCTCRTCAVAGAVSPAPPAACLPRRPPGYPPRHPDPHARQLWSFAFSPAILPEHRRRCSCAHPPPLHCPCHRATKHPSLSFLTPPFRCLLCLPASVRTWCYRVAAALLLGRPHAAASPSGRPRGSRCRRRPLQTSSLHSVHIMKTGSIRSEGGARRGSEGESWRCKDPTKEGIAHRVCHGDWRQARSCCAAERQPRPQYPIPKRMHCVHIMRQTSSLHVALTANEGQKV